MMTPCPTYERLGVKDQSQFCAKFLPNNGIENTTGKKYARSFFFWRKGGKKGKKKRNSASKFVRANQYGTKIKIDGSRQN